MCITVCLYIFFDTAYPVCLPLQILICLLLTLSSAIIFLSTPGNGIQHILEDRDDVMYVSLHRFTKHFYPGTGAAEEVGHGNGKGTTVNIPWECTGLNDADYLAAFDLIIEPIVRQFSPDIVIVSAGFDAVDGDPLGGMSVSPEGT